MSNIIYINNKYNNKFETEQEKYKFDKLFSFFSYKRKYKIKYDYILIDCNSIFIFPYIRYYNDINEIVFKIISNILYINKNQFPNKPKIVLSIDNGTSDFMKKELSYKTNRKSSAKKNIEMFNRTVTNSFNKLIGYIIDMLTPLGVIVDVNKGEADFKIGYFLYNIYNNHLDSTNLVISSDNDYIGMAEFSDILLKRKNYYIYISKGDITLSNLIPSELNLISPYQYYFYKSLIGDRMDNIARLTTNKRAINIINEFNKNIYDSTEKYLDWTNFLNFASDFVDKIQLSKNLFMSIPFNENVFDSDIELDKIKIFFTNNIYNKEIKYDIDLFMDRIKYIKYGGKEYLEDIEKQIRRLYV